MVFLRFVDRRGEVELLRGFASRRRAGVALVYGRGRVGKTRLLLELLKTTLGVYVFVPRGGRASLLNAFSRSLGASLPAGAVFRDLESVFDYFFEAFRRGEIVVVDGFQNLSEVRGALTLLQRYWDEEFSKTNAKLILSGSSLSVIERVSLRGDAPLYGRRSLTLEVAPLEPWALTQWFPTKTPEEVMQIYGVFGGTPAYLEHVDESLNAVENAQRVILSKEGALYDEPAYLLMQEVSSPGAYMDIMGAISAGNQRISEISDYTRIPSENLPKYIASLTTMRLVAKETTQPLGKVSYTFADPFLHFWFRFAWTNRSLLEAGLSRTVRTQVERELDAHLGRVFERVALAYTTRLIREGKLKINPNYVGRWVHQNTEIDIVATAKQEELAYAFEVKWSTLKLEEAQSLLHKLEDKALNI
ncbi:MAG TPA: ATP-binding protein, partial [Chthonomonas sp.]|uniref:ATP-binding protein n=1 Tax=Chthonomonas sp. TaxID=2282153 RepID=UPI002B4AC29B